MPGVTPTWTVRPSTTRSVAIFIGGSLLILGGVIGLGFLLASNGAYVAPTMKRLPALALAGLGLVVMIVEATLFTILPIELSRRFLKHRWPGVALGFVAYVIGIHWDNGLRGLAVSAWVWGVVTGAYLIERQGSLPRACGQAIGLKLAFWTLAFAALSAGGVIHKD